MEQLINDYFRCLDAMGWERDITITKGCAFDELTNSADFDYVVKTAKGFAMHGYKFIYA